jgi:hypothetical protein
VPRGPIPSVLNHLLGSNIRHVLEDIDLDSEESVGMKDDNMGPTVTAKKAVKTPQKPLSPIPKAGATSWSLTPKRPRSPVPAGVNRASGSKRPSASETFESESLVEVQPEGANWTVRGKLARFEGDLKGNPFKAMVDLIDHDKL